MAGVKRGGAISHFLLGLEAPAHERQRWGTPEHKLYYPFCKVSTGYQLLRTLPNLTLTHLPFRTLPHLAFP